MVFKNIRIKMRGGGTRLQRVKVLASGKYKFVKNIGRKLTRRSSKKKTTRKRGGTRKMGKRKKRRRGGKSILRTGFKLIRLGALAAPGLGVALRTDLSPQAKIDGAFRMYTGYEMSSGRWKFEWLASGWLPYIGACLATYGIPKLTSIIRRL